MLSQEKFTFTSVGTYNYTSIIIIITLYGDYWARIKGRYLEHRADNVCPRMTYTMCVPEISRQCTGKIESDDDFGIYTYYLTTYSIKNKNVN